VSAWSWLALAGLLLLLEAFTPGFAFLWLALSAALTGLVLWVWPSLAWQAQVVAFAGLAVASVAAWQVWRRRHPATGGDPTLNRRTAGLVGAEAVLVAPTGVGHGRVRVGDTTWLAEGPSLAAGARVRIVGARGSVLLVAPTDAPASAQTLSESSAPGSQPLP
jgi:hypothetical protein